MNQVDFQFKEEEPEEAIIDALRTLRPRNPRIDLAAIDSAVLAVKPADRDLPAEWDAGFSRRHLAVAWWSGLAAGVAITFLAMQLLVVSHLRTKIVQLEPAAIQSEDPPREHRLPEGGTTVNTPAVDWNRILNSPDLSVGSYRLGLDRLIHTHVTALDRIDFPMTQNSDSKSGQIELEIDPPKSQTNRLQLLEQLQGEVY